MNYKEACDASDGQKYAFANPEFTSALPFPDPETPAVINCLAPEVPAIIPNSEHQTDGGQVIVSITYLPNPSRKCIKICPDCAACPVSSTSEALEPKDVVLTKREFVTGDLSRFSPENDRPLSD